LQAWLTAIALTELHESADSGKTMWNRVQPTEQILAKLTCFDALERPSIHRADDAKR
jgi:hypothetical protein